MLDLESIPDTRQSNVSAVLLVVVAAMIGGCSGGAGRGGRVATTAERLAVAASEIGVDRVEPDVPVASDLVEGAAAALRLAVRPSPDGRMVTFYFVNESPVALPLDTRDGTPLLGIEAFVPARGGWARVWGVDPSTCGNAELLLQIQPGRALTGVLRSRSKAAPVSVRLVLGELRSKTTTLAMDPVLLEGG